MIHEYFGVELGLVWDVVEDELPLLRPQLERLSKRLEEEGGSDSPAGLLTIGGLRVATWRPGS